MIKRKYTTTGNSAEIGKYYTYLLKIEIRTEI